MTRSLEPCADLALARETLERYAARDAEQERYRRTIVDWIDAHPEDAHLRSCLQGHLTASVVLFDHARERTLLHHHKKLDKWLQFGGHCDGDANFRGTAWRELVEESGIEPAWLSPEPIDVDVHPIPARPGEPAHDHLDVRFVAVAPEGARERRSEESLELCWFGRRELGELELDPSLARLLEVAWGTLPYGME